MLLHRVFAALLLTIAVSAFGQRARIVRPPAVYVGQAQVVVSYSLSSTTLEEVRLREEELLAAGLRLSGDRLVSSPIPASGFRVLIGEQNVMVRSDGSFIVLPVPRDVVTGEVVGKEGAIRTTFVVADHLVPQGGRPAPIVLSLELSDRPNLMNEWDRADGTAEAHTHHEPHQQEGPSAALCPGPDPATCTKDPNCPANPTTCCLDYNGLCADGSRYRGGSCTLRFLQFAGST